MFFDFFFKKMGVVQGGVPHGFFCTTPLALSQGQDGQWV